MLPIRWAAALFLFLLLQSQLVWSHEVRPSIFTLTFDQQRSFSISVSANVEALIAEIGADHDDTDDAPNANLYRTLRALPSSDMQERFKAFSPQWMSQLGLTFKGAPAALDLKQVDIPAVGDLELARESTILMVGQVPQGIDQMQWAYPEKFGASVLRIERPGQELQAQFYGAGTKSDVIKVGLAEPRSWAEKFFDYGVIGFTHILPKGLDHILFVLGLFLLNTNWRPLLVQVTAFTLAHSVTLALGLYGIVTISPAIVEPLIALSIVYVAVENLFTSRLHAWRPVIVFLFGLLHGLGFAGILTEIGLPKSDFVLGLVAFNVGVELGQLAVIALAFAAIGWFAKKQWYRRRITNPASLIIAAAGAWWFVERVFL